MNTHYHLNRTPSPWLYLGFGCLFVFLCLSWIFSRPQDRDIRVCWGGIGEPNQYEVFHAEDGNYWRIMLPHTIIGARVAMFVGGELKTSDRASASRPGHPSSPADYSTEQLRQIPRPRWFASAADGMIVVEREDGTWTVWTPELLKLVLARTLTAEKIIP